jgi:hypothetical protein
MGVCRWTGGCSKVFIDNNPSLLFWHFSRSRISFFVSASSPSTFAAVLQVLEITERKRKRDRETERVNIYQIPPLNYSLLGKDYMRCLTCGVVSRKRGGLNATIKRLFGFIGHQRLNTLDRLTVTLVRFNKEKLNSFVWFLLLRDDRSVPSLHFYFSFSSPSPPTFSSQQHLRSEALTFSQL